MDRQKIAREFAHRVAADPITCPVCCGDKMTVDAEYGGRIVHMIDEGTVNERAVRECRACNIWIAGLPVRECVGPCGDADWMNTDGDPQDAFMACHHPNHWSS